MDDKAEAIKKQFEKLQAVSLNGLMSAAERPENATKNRYKGLYPADPWRVELNPEETEDGSDYINASYIKGFKEENRYVAAQGPMAGTVSDFWLMAVQTGTSVIVMLTNTHDGGKVKCERYWPEENCTQTYNSVTVRNQLTENMGDYSVRTLHVTKDSRLHIIKQFHFTSWPDLSVPQQIKPFITFCRLVQKDTEYQHSPVIIHCSAGVGRTGTFIALDYLREEGEEAGTVDVYACIKRMRERRPSMIETGEQFFFLYEVLFDPDFTEKSLTMLI